jgi:hypothetical protein
MYLTTHATVGILVSQTVDRPVWVFLLSMLSHFILDFIPHGDETIGEWIRKRKRNAFLLGALDTGLLTVIVLILAQTQNLPEFAIMTAGILGAILPDLLSNIFPFIHEYTNWFFLERLIHRTLDKMQFRHLWRFHNWFHRITHNSTRLRLTIKQGLILQSIVTFGAAAATAFIRR